MQFPLGAPGFHTVLFLQSFTGAVDLQSGAVDQPLGLAQRQTEGLAQDQTGRDRRFESHDW